MSPISFEKSFKPPEARYSPKGTSSTNSISRSVGRLHTHAGLILRNPAHEFQASETIMKRIVLSLDGSVVLSAWVERFLLSSYG
ncbi:hypothetical protein BGZ93_009197, partial [Podila epicladia]